MIQPVSEDGNSQHFCVFYWVAENCTHRLGYKQFCSKTEFVTAGDKQGYLYQGPNRAVFIPERTHQLVADATSFRF